MRPVVLASLADEPVAMVAIALAWCACGLAVAAAVARRGHSFRHVAGLGVVLGPLLLGFAAASLREKEQSATPVVVREARALGGEERVLVAVVGDPGHVDDALGVLRAMRDRLHVVDIGVTVTFDDADEERETEELISTEAIEILERAAVRLGEFTPGMVLLPGRAADALVRYVESDGADLVVIAGDEDAQTTLCHDRTLLSLTTVVGSSGVRI